MTKYFILLSSGRDRPGIVDDISTLLFDKGANIEDSRMAVMGGCFSSMTLFSCTPAQAEAIRTGLDHLKGLGLEAHLHPAEDPAAGPVLAGLPLKFEMTAMDHPGIVQRVVRLLREHDVNIESLETEVTKAPLSGAPLFDLRLEAKVPADKPIGKVKEQLADLAGEMNLDLVFKV
jgi:glycine cleavage system transcriptional repressor